MEKGSSCWGHQGVHTITIGNSGWEEEEAEDENQRKEEEGKGRGLRRFLPLLPLLMIIMTINKINHLIKKSTTRLRHLSSRSVACTYLKCSILVWPLLRELIWKMPIHSSPILINFFKEYSEIMAGILSMSAILREMRRRRVELSEISVIFSLLRNF